MLKFNDLFAMKYSLTADPIQHFEENGWVSFEGLITLQEAEALRMEPARDSWREHEEVQRIVTRSRLAQVAAELLRKTFFRLAYTERLEQVPEGTLAERSCVQGLEIGLLLDLRSLEGTYIRADVPLQGGHDTFVITYAGERACYIHNEGDPHTHLWKKLGMAFGDRLAEPMQPVVWRR